MDAPYFEQLFPPEPLPSPLLKREPPPPLDVEMRAALALDIGDWGDYEPQPESEDSGSSTGHASGDDAPPAHLETPPLRFASPMPSPAPSLSLSEVSSSSFSSAAKMSAAQRLKKKNAVPAEVLAHMPLPPRSDHVDQKERNRLIVKRCYYKKISTLNELRGELDRVDAHYKQLLRQKHAESARPTSAEEIARQRSRQQQLHAAYVEVTLLSDTLQRENDELRRLEADYAKMEKQMAQLHLQQHKNVQLQRATQEHKRRNPIVELHALTTLECRAIAMNAYARIKAFKEHEKLSTTGANIFGWRDRHCVKNDKLMFLLEKHFPQLSAEYMSDTVWSLLSKAESLADTYSPHLDVLYHEVQRVDADNVVFYHTLERPGTVDLRIKALMLASRVYLGPEDGWLILFRGLDPKRYLIREGEPPRPRDRRGRNKIEPQKEDIWIDTFVWGIFKPDATGKGCLEDFGGIVDGTQLISASVWMIEKLQFVVRCEAKVVGPQFLLAL